MTAIGTVTTVQANQYRVNIGGSLSAPITCLTGAFRFQVDSDGVIQQLPPSVGDRVLCWFPGEAYCDGYIVGIAEESL